MSSTTSTDKLGEYSAGASEILFATHWDLNPFLSQYQTQGTTDYSPLAFRTGVFNVSMETQGVAPPGFGAVHFSWSGIQPSQESIEAAIMVFFCTVMLLHIPPDGLREAFEQLKKISSHYEEWPAELPALAKTKQVTGVEGRTYQRPDFYIEE